MGHDPTTAHPPPNGPPTGGSAGGGLAAVSPGGGAGWALGGASVVSISPLLARCASLLYACAAEQGHAQGYSPMQSYSPHTQGSGSTPACSPGGAYAAASPPTDPRPVDGRPSAHMLAQEAVAEYGGSVASRQPPRGRRGGDPRVLPPLPRRRCGGWKQPSAAAATAASTLRQLEDCWQLEDSAASALAALRGLRESGTLREPQLPCERDQAHARRSVSATCMPDAAPRRPALAGGGAVTRRLGGAAVDAVERPRKHTRETGRAGLFGCGSRVRSCGRGVLWGSCACAIGRGRAGFVCVCVLCVSCCAHACAGVWVFAGRPWHGGRHPSHCLCGGSYDLVVISFR